jgi:lactate dehydrogenase-like 2-hydroxyacid dehydrogenase
MERPTVAVLMGLETELIDRLAAVADLELLDEGAPRSDKLSSVAAADGVLVFGATTVVDSGFLDAAPRLRVVSTSSVGYDHIDVAAATVRSIAVCHTPGVLNEAVVDLTMVLIYSLARRLFENERFVRSGGWAAREMRPPLGIDVRGKTLGIIGYGRIGRAVATRMRSLGMQIVWHDVAPGEPPDPEQRSFEEVLRRSDFVSLHANLQPGAPPIIGEAELRQMKPNAFLINTGRGALVDQAALNEALQAHVIGGAGLDVLAVEPPDSGDPIVRLPNVIALPHIGSATEETRRAMRDLAVDNLMAALAGRRPAAMVNPEVFDPGAEVSRSI